MNCPTCGVKLDHQFVWDAVTRVFIAGGKAIRFPEGEAKVFNAVWRARGRGGITSRGNFMQAVYGDDINGGPDCPSIINVHLSRIRRKLKGSGYTITRNKNQNAMNGYRIEREAMQ